MADRLTPQERSALMSRVRGKDTKPEKCVRSALHRLGYRFRLHSKALPGRPDVVLSRHRVVVFVHGCFWHSHPGCRRAARPTSNRRFWNTKIDRNVGRDCEVALALRRLGWRVVVVWECWTRNDDALGVKLRRLLRTRGDRHDKRTRPNPIVS